MSSLCPLLDRRAFPRCDGQKSSRIALLCLLDPKDLDGLLLKEAVYTAIGKNLGDLAGVVDPADGVEFETRLMQALVPEAASTDPKYVS